MKKSLSLIVLLSLLTSCASDHHDAFTAFNNQRVWPTAKGTVPDAAYVVPVYHDWPERPYRVLGCIQFEKTRNDLRDEDTARAAILSKRKGGDGLVVGPAIQLGLENGNPAAADQHGSSSTEIIALVIKWKSRAEMDAEKKIWNGFETRFRAEHPDREVRDDLLGMSVDYGAYLGLNLDSAAGVAKLENDLNKVVKVSADGAPTRWLFRGVFHVTALTSSFTETVYGIATMSGTDGSVSIVSKSEKADIQFDGIARDGRLSGTINISAGPVVCKARAAGTLVPNRISLDSRGENANEMVRGSFIFLR